MFHAIVEAQDEDTSSFSLTLAPDLTAMHLDDLLDDRQAQPRRLASYLLRRRESIE